MDEQRRSLLAALSGAAALPLLGATDALASVPAPVQSRFGSSVEEAAAIGRQAQADLARELGPSLRGTEQIAMIVYPGMTMLDFVGPQYFFASLMGAKVHLVSKDKSLHPLMGDTGFAIVPTISMADCPADLDLMFLPGGTRGTIDFINDTESIAFVADRAARARYVTSVCTGAMILGKAGLLRGKRATTHWAFHHLLPLVGAKPVDDRVVQDGNVLTGAGVSAGLDLALAALAALRGDAVARLIQLQGEYAPKPMFNAGTPRAIGPRLAQPMQRVFARAIYLMEQSVAAVPA